MQESGLKLLADAGIRTLMLTGDNGRTAEAIGGQLGSTSNPTCCPRTSSESSGVCGGRAGPLPR